MVIHPNEISELLSLMKLLSERLERLSADSVYAHRASGYRGNLLRQIQQLENLKIPLNPDEYTRLQLLIESCYLILVQAGREIY